MSPGALQPVDPQLADAHPMPTSVSGADEVLGYLRDALGLSEAEVARALGGADSRSVRRWLTGGTVQARFLTRIDDLRDLVDILSDGLAPLQIGRWLRARNRDLERERPLDVLAEAGGYIRVRSAAEAYLQGDPV